MKKNSQQFPPQTQPKQPGLEDLMEPKPQESFPAYKGSGKLTGKVALITGGDSGIGRAVALLYAKEGADVSIVYLNEDKDAQDTKKMVEQEGQRCFLLSGDVGEEVFCIRAVEQTVETFGHLDIVVNNAAEQHPQPDLEHINRAQLEKTFCTNIFAMFFMTKAALKHLPEGSSIINTASVTAYRGSPQLLDYSATKGAIISFTRSLALNLVDKGIRVNAVAPGPIWTPLIPATFPGQKVETFGSDVPMKRAGQPNEVAPCYVFLASNIDSSYITGQVLHPNGGEMTGS